MNTAIDDDDAEDNDDKDDDVSRVTSSKTHTTFMKLGAYHVRCFYLNYCMQSSDGKKAL